MSKFLKERWVFDGYCIWTEAKHPLKLETHTISVKMLVIPNCKAVGAHLTKLHNENLDDRRNL